MAQRTRPKRTPKSQNGAAAAIQRPVPDALGEANRIQLVAQQLLRVQSQLFELDVIQEANAAEDTDFVPNANVQPGASLPTYAEHRAMLEAAQGRITKRWEDLMPEVEAFLAGAQKGMPGP